MLSRLKTRKVLGVGETENGDVHRSKVHHFNFVRRLDKSFSGKQQLLHSWVPWPLSSILESNTTSVGSQGRDAAVHRIDPALVQLLHESIIDFGGASSGNISHRPDTVRVYSLRF